MKVLGIDPGLTRCGVGVLTGEPGKALSLIAVDVIRTPPAMPLADRLHEISHSIARWIDEHQPDEISVERVFVQANRRSAMETAQASGIALALAAARKIPVSLHTPSEVKAAVTGSGRADKAQVAEMVRRLLRLKERPEPADAADALALAICHIYQSASAAKIRERQRSSEGAK
ncbi:MAG: crossover junction endodeoxyribonuclease RuvC [Actinobacteria bacterium]|jgi:crossover junction endodeoxyribonuclease RuvC|nr:crossover junction endodeoxyribonuclease RuvC [Actinomycetota bacterium]